MVVLLGADDIRGDLAELYGKSLKRTSRSSAAASLVTSCSMSDCVRAARVRTVSAAEAVAIMECRMVLDGLLGDE